MEEKAKKVLDAIFCSNVRDLLTQANECGITKDSFVSIFEKDGLVFLIFEKTIEINPENSEEGD